ncbi:hypothetical protein [Alkaliphilus serpentinus]|uniref:Lipoprotein n=1 Tax=Alkaliphilus serpentinus TaxID=1482731 RepID=A0A833HRN5_9FIRM|nr:hypothetical protein [Alkaliphilus serpentinus]KAB3533562.1 hypothetical protein F8153_00480 [Alkaliphilus serpentinus]
MRNYNKTKIFFILIALIMIITSCSGNPKPQEEKDNSNSPPELPKVYTEIEEEILKTMFSIDGIAGIEKALEEKEKAKEEVAEESEVDLKPEEKEKPAKEEIDVKMLVKMEAVVIPLLEEEDIESEIVMVDEVPGDINKVWYQINQLVNTLHTKWNSLEPHLQKAGVDPKKIQEFEGNLDSTTVFVNEKDTHQSMIALNHLLSNLYDFGGSFKTKIPSEVMKIKNHIREIVLMADAEDYPGALSNFEEAKRLGEALKQRLIEKDATDVLQKFELSMEDLNKELQKENFNLIQIKGGIVLKNTVAMKEAFEGESK